MMVLTVVMGVALLVFCMLYIRLCRDIRALAGQVEEIRRGSHIELTVGSRQRALLALCRKLNQALLDRDRKRIQYERAQKQLKQNITALAHDIRTPLTGASGYVQLARECREPEKREHYLGVAEQRLARLSDMLEKLFLYTKLSNEEFVISRENMRDIQVLPLLSECLLGFYTEFEEQGTAPEVQFASPEFKVFGEEEALRRTFLNLIQNALVHGNGGLTVIQKEDKTLVFENPFPGEGRIDPEQLFDCFYKADPSRRKGSSGLGLFIVRELMRRLGGDARAEVEEGRFRVLLFFRESVE